MCACVENAWNAKKKNTVFSVVFLFSHTQNSGWTKEFKEKDRDISKSTEELGIVAILKTWSNKEKKCNERKQQAKKFLKSIIIMFKLMHKAFLVDYYSYSNQCFSRGGDEVLDTALQICEQIVVISVVKA